MIKCEFEFEFDSEGLPAADRFAHEPEVMSHQPVALDLGTDRGTGFRMRQRDLHLDTLRVWSMAMGPATMRRSMKLIQQSDPEACNIVLLQSGMMGRTWDRHETTYRPSDLHVNDSSRPFELRAHNTCGLITCMGVEIPKRLLPLPHATDRLAGRRLSGQGGMGALLAGFLNQLAADTGFYRPSDRLRLSTVLVNLVSALFAHVLEADDTLAPETRQGTLLLRIRTFIQQHLDDPDLSPGTVAAAHYISTSYLHRLFRPEGATVAGWIREQRLERIRRDLADSAMATIPIGQIAARWGFTDRAVFSRVFRTAYGIAPRDYRHLAVQLAG